MRSTTHRIHSPRAESLSVDDAAGGAAARHHCPVSRVAYNSARGLWTPWRSDWKTPGWDVFFFLTEAEARRASAMEEAYALTFYHRSRTQTRGASDERAVSELTLLWKAVNVLPYTKEERASMLGAAERAALLRLAAEPGGRASAGPGLPFECARRVARDLMYARLAEIEGDTLAGDGPIVLTLTAEGAAVAAHLRGVAPTRGASG